MKIKLIRASMISIVLLLAACGGTDEAAAPKVSRMEPAAGGGMTYQQFRGHDVNEGSEIFATQKRFIMLDRNNNGILSPDEFNGY